MKMGSAAALRPAKLGTCESEDSVAPGALRGLRTVPRARRPDSRLTRAPAGGLIRERTRGRFAMERVYERCCGLDVHKGCVTASVHVPRREGGRGELVESFTTM